MKGILGRKLGMTQVFATDGTLIPVTVVEATPNVVLHKKTVETDGYCAIQVGFEDKREKLANKAEKGHVAKANTAPKRFIKEFRYDEMMSYEVGDLVKVDSFVEKPSKEQALKFIENSKYLWNTGIYVAKLSVLLNAIEKYSPMSMSNFSKEGTSYFVSYRDPNLKQTIDVYEQAPAFLREFAADEELALQYKKAWLDEINALLGEPTVISDPFFSRWDKTEAETYIWPVTLTNADGNSQTNLELYWKHTIYSENKSDYTITIQLQSADKKS